MNRNGMPAVLGLSLVAGKEEVYEFAVEDFSGASVGVDFNLFRVHITGEGGESHEVGSEVDGNVVKVTFPALGQGEYKWALVATDSSGVSDVLISGKLGVFWPDLKADSEPIRTPNRRAVVRWGDGRAVVRWQRTDFVKLAADSAQDALSEISKKMVVVEGFLALFDGKLSTAVYVDPATGHLIVGGVDQGVKVPGTDGKSPYVDADGHWKYWNDAQQVWVDGGSAIGKDGRDGTTIRRILAASYDDIPKSGENCNGGVYYYIPNGELYDIYAWFEADGWLRVDMKYDLADTDTYGLMKYGTDALVEQGAPVGRNAAGQARVPLATENEPGAVKTCGVSYTQCPVYTDANNNLTVPIVGGENASGALMLSVPLGVDVAGDMIFRAPGGGPGIAIASETHYGVVKKATDLSGEGYVSGEMFANNMPDVYSKEQVYTKEQTYSKDEVYSKEQSDERYVAKGGDFHLGVDVMRPEDFSSITRDPAIIYFVKRQANV